jgi:hypothetical protein
VITSILDEIDIVLDEEFDIFFLLVVVEVTKGEKLVALEVRLGKEEGTWVDIWILCEILRIKNIAVN